MKKHFQYSFLILFLVALNATGQEKGIKFGNDSYQQLLERSESEHKVIFIDAYTTWCGPCKMMTQKVFSLDSVAEFYNNNFICAKFDAEKGEGKMIAKKYNIDAYPTYLFLDDKGNEVHRYVGALSPAKFMDLGRTAINPEKRVGGFRDVYEKDKTNPESVYNYALALKQAGYPYSGVALEYLAPLNERQLFQASAWNILHKFTNEDSTRYLNFVIDNQDTLRKLFKPQDVDDYVYIVYFNKMRDLLSEKQLNKAAYLYYLNKIRPYATDFESKKFLTRLNTNYYVIADERENFIAEAKLFIDSFATTAKEYHFFAFTFSNKFITPENLLLAEKWSAKSISLQQLPSNTAGYANILYKLERYEEAEKYALLSQELNEKAGGEKNDELEKLIKDIRKKTGKK